MNAKYQVNIEDKNDEITTNDYYIKIYKNGDHFTGNIDISVDEWFEVKDEIEKKVENNEYSIPVRIPSSFVTKDRFIRNPEYYGYCTCKTRSALLVHPNGMLRICPLLIGTPYRNRQIL